MLVKKTVNLSDMDVWYDFTEGGYLEPEDFLVDEEDILRVMEARNIIDDYFAAIHAEYSEDN